MHRIVYTALAALLFAAALASIVACSNGSTEQQSETAPPPGPVQYTRVRTPTGGISFEVPATWPRDGDAPTWRPAPDDPRRLSVRVLSPAPADPRTVLPGGATVLSQSRRDLGWAAGTEYRLRVERAGSTADEQTHVLVAMGTKALFHFMTAVPAGADPGPPREALEHLLTSVILENPSPSPMAGRDAAPAGGAVQLGATNVVAVTAGSRGRTQPM